MTLKAYYNDGTATLTNGSADVTFQGAGVNLLTNKIFPGDRIESDIGEMATIETVGPGSLEATLDKVFRGTSQVAQPYKIWRTFDAQYLMEGARKAFDLLGSGGIAALAALDGADDQGLYFTAPGVLELFSLTAAGRALMAAAAPDAQLSELGFSTFAKTLIDAADAATARAKIAALGGALGANDNRLLRADGTGGATAQGSAATLDDSGNLSGIAGLTMSANLSGATATLSGLLTLTGGQIKFPATPVPSADANTLDDYEEGSYTPTPSFGGGSAGMVAPVRSGRYIKVGALAIVWGYITLSAKGSSTGVAGVTGMPFQASTNASFYGGSVPFFGSMPGVTVAGCAMPAGGTAMTLYLPPGGVLTDVNFNNTSSIMFSVAYEVA
ncbi:hypothetical protein FJ422_16285 [Mesorhizobium sp. B2-6-3]|uniref:hypothetical protein n=1 Tax=Mesorhizobium sp. B2-6-3 TaxID=2589914 RepID=UPI00112A128B|nr:hypothetical protein [Mesorhizobium sp. B2-6-3]TPJ83830.1 hypothetical protein FJ422_16285 [Mesorhizobium sp. B2-6-3]